MIRVSDLVHYLLCPRIVFYERSGLRYEPRTDPARAAKKAVALALSRPGAEEGRLLLHIRPGPPEGEAKPEGGGVSRGTAPLRALEEWDRAMERVGRELGPGAREALAGWSPGAAAGFARAREVQPSLESVTLGLRGEVDKTVLREGREVPALVRATGPPSSGAWRSDRAALAAYAMLLEEARGAKVERGIVEYVESLPPVAREVRITGYDRNLVRALLDRVRKMGPRRPGRPWRAPCRTCNFYGLCFPKGRRLF